MPYDELGNYVPGNEEPSGALPRQELDTAVKHLKRTATEYNPLMMLKSLQDLPRAAYNMSVAPALSTWAGALKGAQAEGAARIYEGLGMPEDAARVRSAIEPITPTGFQAPLQTPMGEAFQEGVGKAAETAKLPHMWPMAVSHLETRPMLTPNDVRVMGAEATRVGRQIRDIPTDFANAQAGITRLDPVTNKPTIGAKLQGAAEDVGRIVEQRKAQGLSPVPGVPGALTPETSMYAMRPTGTSIVVPKFPETRDPTTLPLGASPYKVIHREIPESPELSPGDVQEIWNNKRVELNIPQDDFKQYLKQQALNKYPDAPSGEAALDAWQDIYDNHHDWAKVIHGEFENFLKTPEGQASPLSQLPSATQLQERHKAARNWLYGPFINYMRKHIGTEADPLLKLASEGMTLLKPENLEHYAQMEVNQTDLGIKRVKAGMPKEGVVQPALKAKQDELSAAEADLAKYQTRREAYRDIAMQQGLQDPAQLPEYAQTTNQIAAATRQVNKLQEQVNNLRLGKTYEDLADVAVTARQQPSLANALDYTSQQYYPSIMKAKPDEILYTLGSSDALRSLGFDELANHFYRDVIDGKIPVEQIPKLSVEKYVRNAAEGRIKADKEALLKAQEWKSSAEQNMLRTMKMNTPEGNYFGNVGVIELTKATGLDLPTLTKIVSEDTTVLDHCIGQGGSAGGEDKNPWFPKSDRSYAPIYDAATGERNPRAARDTSSYASAVLAGDMISSVRDRNTGIPVATFQFHRSHIDPDTGKQVYGIGYASGHKNGEVKPEYRDSIKDYLNARADQISSLGSHVPSNLDIHDTQQPKGNLAADTSIPTRDLQLLDFSGSPRFMTTTEIRDMVKAAKSLPATQPAVARQQAGEPLQLVERMPAALRNDVQSAFDNAVEHLESLGADAAGNEAEAARRLSQLFIDVTDRYFTNNAVGFNLANAIEYLERTRENYNNHGGMMQMLIANEGITQALTDLEGIRSAAERGHYTPAAPAQAPAQRVFGEVDFDNFVADIAQNVDAQIADDLVRTANTIANGMGTNVRGAVENNPTEFATRLAELADTTQNNILEEALRELADRIAPPVRDINAPVEEQFNFEPDVGHPANEPPRLAAHTPIPDAVGDMTVYELRQSMHPVELDDVSNAAHDIIRFNPLSEELLHIADMVRNHRMSTWENFSDVQRAWLAIRLDSAADAARRNAATQGAELRPIGEHANNATYEQLQESLTPAEQGEVSAIHDEIVRGNPNPDEIRNIAQMVYNHQMGLWQNLPDTARAMLYMELTYTANRMEGEPPNTPPEEPQHFKDGGQVSYPSALKASNEAIMRAQEMYPQAQGQDDQADAARHMLASGYMSQAFGPAVAKGLGYLHELKEAPFRTAGSWLGLSQPRYDYAMDVHNNALGADLAQKAKNRLEFEKMVQQAIQQGTTTTQPGRARLMTPEQANEGRGMLKYANGGTVSSKDKIAVLLRSK